MSVRGHNSIMSAANMAATFANTIIIALLLHHS